MGKLDQQFYEDRALRDAAREVVMADIAHAKSSLSGKSITGRVTGRIGEGAKDVFEVAKAHGEDNRGIIAALIGAIILWLAREPILEILGLEKSASEADQEPTEVAEAPTTDSEPLHEEVPTPKTPLSGDSDD